MGLGKVSADREKARVEFHEISLRAEKWARGEHPTSNVQRRVATSGGEAAVLNIECRKFNVGSWMPSKPVVERRENPGSKRGPA
jgi:hypothetical protein